MALYDSIQYTRWLLICTRSVNADAHFLIKKLISQKQWREVMTMNDASNIFTPYSVLHDFRYIIGNRTTLCHTPRWLFKRGPKLIRFRMKSMEIKCDLTLKTSELWKMGKEYMWRIITYITHCYFHWRIIKSLKEESFSLGLDLEKEWEYGNEKIK